MIGREFVRRLRWSHGRIETVTTRFELDKGGQLIEHVTLEVQERPMFTAPLAPPPVKRPAATRQEPSADARSGRWV